MGTTTLETLIEKMSINIGDFIEVATTTNITTDTNVKSTTLNNYDDGADDYFIGWWCLIDGTNNAEIERQVEDYTTSGGICDVRGANLSAETAAVDVRLYKYSRTDKVNAIVDAILEKSPEAFIALDDRSLITNNILPDSHFDWWATATTLEHWSLTNVTLAKTGSLRGPLNTLSAKATDSGSGGGYFYVDSVAWPRLLDLMGNEVDFRAWALPQTANDAVLKIETWQADGTSQSLSSTTANPITYFTLLNHDGQSLNDDLTKVRISFLITTASQHVTFDNARLIGPAVHEYLLPEDLQDGRIDQVLIQSSGYADYLCDDIMPPTWDRVYNWDTTNDGTYKYLYLPDTYGSEKQIRLIGRKPLEDLSGSTVTGASTISLDNEKIRPLLAYACHLLFARQADQVSTVDRSMLEFESAKWLGRYNYLSKLNPRKPSRYFHLPNLD